MNESTQNTALLKETVRFRWSFILFPIIMLAVSIVITAIFYSQLPDVLQFSFTNGNAVRETEKTAIILMLLGSNAFFSVLALIIVRMMVAAARFWTGDASLIDRMMQLVGNIPGLAQLIIALAVLHIFIYNAYDVMIGSFQVVVIALLVLGAVVIGLQLVRLYIESRMKNNSSGD